MEIKEATKVILVGRHTSELPPEIEVVAQENILWATSAQECEEQFFALIDKARELGAAVLFQNVPGILAAVMMRYAFQSQGTGMSRMGVIISVPGAREAGVSMTRGFDDAGDMAAAKELISHANGRAKIETPNAGQLTVTVDPVTPFVFSHIEWF